MPRSQLHASLLCAQRQRNLDRGGLAATGNHHGRWRRLGDLHTRHSGAGLGDCAVSTHRNTGDPGGQTRSHLNPRLRENLLPLGDTPHIKQVAQILTSVGSVATQADVDA